MWHDIDQLSSDWLHMRCSCVTASHVCDVMAKLKRLKEGEKKEAAARRNYRKQKIREYLTGKSMETYVSPYMEAGMDNEPLARAAYEIATDSEVLHGGLFAHDGIPRFMASPDGRIGDDGLLEIKYLSGSTTEANHVDLLLGESEVPEDYLLQMQAQLACSGRAWVDFVSYDPDMPKELQLFVKRFERNEQMIAAIEGEVVQFLTEMVETLKKLGAIKEAFHAVQA